MNRVAVEGAVDGAVDGAVEGGEAQHATGLFIHPSLFALLGGVDVDDAYLLARVLVPYVRVYLGGLLAPEVAVRALVAGLEAALVRIVTLEVALEGEAAVALGAVILLLAPLRPLGYVSATALAVAPGVRTVHEVMESVQQRVCKQRRFIGFYWLLGRAAPLAAAHCFLQIIRVGSY
jgi:hypothetical protein